MFTHNILYEDNHLLVVVKPAGIGVQSDDSGDLSLQEIYRAYIKEKYEKPGNVFMGLVHRLDRPVSGVFCLARTSKGASRLSEQFRRREPEKIYHAVVEGIPEHNEGKLVHWIVNSSGRRRKSVAHDDDKKGGKKAELLYKVLKKGRSRSLIEIKLITGYKHQIRAQFATIGLPVVGDYKYDNRRPPAKVEQLYDGRAIALHARSIKIMHPTKKEEMLFVAPFPKYWPEII